MKKTMILVLSLVMAVLMIACAAKSTETKNDTPAPAADTQKADQQPAEAAAPAVTEAPAATEAPTEEPTAEPTEEPTPEPTEEPTPEPTEEPTPEPTEEPTEEPTAEPAAEDVQYVNFDKMHFWINGVEFVLGESTLQDMIDSGVVPFRAEDLEDAKNNLKKNYQSAGFRIDLGEYWSAQVYVLNDTDEGKPTNECYINEIYLPNKPDQTQDILKFDFPLNMTMDELKANAGEPEADNYRHYDGDNGYYSDTFKYTRPSTKYYGNSYYSFEYVKGELNYVYINYMP